MIHLRIFYPSILVTAVGCLLGFLWGGLTGLFIIILLSVLEISLSFDNAVVNAKILQNMSPRWQKHFLTWGVIIAVFGVRILFPVLLVSILTGLSFFEVLNLAFNEPLHYAKHLLEIHTALSAFGGMFLWMVFVSFLFDKKRSIHWLGKIEKKFSEWGQLPFIEVIIALILLLIVQFFIPLNEKSKLLIPGIAGIVLFAILKTSTRALAKKQKMLKRGLSGFIYLEVLDASFSLDGVMGGFAITKDLILIILGLTIGAMFVRSITLFLVHKKTLAKYQYLEHGAHYAVGALALLMLLGILIPISEVLIGCIGISIIAISLISSLQPNIIIKKNK